MASASSAVDVPVASPSPALPVSPPGLGPMGEMAAAMAAASGSATPEYAPQVPEFSPDDLCRQLNEWKRAVEGELINTGRHHRELHQTVVQANGSLMLVGQKVEDLTTGINEKMGQMTSSGVAALRKTIEEFQLKISQHE